MIFDYLSSNTIWDIIIIPFLSINDVSKLELAFTNHLIRLHNNYIFYNVSWKVDEVIEIDNYFFVKWLFDRKIIIPSIIWKTTADHLKYVVNGVVSLDLMNVFGRLSYRQLISILKSNQSTIKSLYISDRDETIRPNQLLEISKLTTNLNKLYLNDNSQTFGLEIIPLLWPQITSIHLCSKLSKKAIYDKDINIISQSLVHTIEYSRIIPNCVLMKLIDWFPRVHTLILSHCEQLTNMSLIALFKNVTTLQHISLSNCTYIDNEAYCMLALSYNSQLKSISFSNCPLLDDKSINCIANECSNLISISFVQCPEIRLDSLAKVISNTQLKQFKLSKCELISSHKQELLMLMLNSKVIEEIYIEEFSSVLVEKDKEDFEPPYLSLTSLRIKSDNRNLLKDACNSINLKELDCSYSSINSTVLSRYLKDCPMIQIMKFNKCNSLTNKSLELIARTHCSLHLIELHISSCLSINEIGLSYIANTCKRLKLLDISYVNVKNFGYDVVTMPFNNLRILIAKAVHGYNNICYSNIKSNSHIKIRHIDYEYSNISYDYLIQVCSVSSQLEGIVIHNLCKTITNKMIQSIQSLYPHLRIIRKDSDVLDK